MILRHIFLEHLTLQWQFQCVGSPPLSPLHWSGWWGWSVWQWKWRLLGVGVPCWLDSCGGQGQAQEPVGSQWPWAQSLHTVTTTPVTISVILSHAIHIGKLHRMWQISGRSATMVWSQLKAILYWLFCFHKRGDICGVLCQNQSHF